MTIIGQYGVNAPMLASEATAPNVPVTVLAVPGGSTPTLYTDLTGSTATVMRHQGI